MCVCVCVCVCIFIYIYVDTHKCTHIYAYTPICLYIYIYKVIYTHIYIIMESIQNFLKRLIPIAISGRSVKYSKPLYIYIYILEIRVIPRLFLVILRSSFLEKGRIKPFVHSSIMFWLYMALQYRDSKSSNLLVFHTSGAFSLRLTAFLFLIFVSATLSS